jgi:hypothetical protein
MTREEAQAAWEKIVDTGFSDYDQLSPDQKIWFNIEPLTTGGIIDHYINYGAEHNQDTLKALEFLGFPDIAEQMRRINKLFTNEQPPEDINERNDEWNSWCDEHGALLDEVDDNFWVRSADVETALLAHINRTGIGVD